MFEPRKENTILIVLVVTLTSVIFGDGALAGKSRGETPQSRYLLLDSRVIDNTIGVKLTLGKVQKHPANPLFGQDRPWEHHYDNFYGNIMYDEQLKQFRLWYLNFINGVNSLLYAYSDDGLNWVKPNLGKVEYNGNTNNNIIMMGRHGVGVFKDLRETDPAKRFKLFGKHEALGRVYDQYIEVAFSADGINWSDPIPQKQISATADTDNNAFWAPTLNKYVAMTRQWSRCPYNDQTKAPRHGSPEIDPAIDNRKGYRQVARTESTDFLNWTRAEVVLEGLNTRSQTHCLPVFYYAGVYIGMPGIWDTTGERQVHTELAWSPDTVNWHRICPGTSVIPNSDVKGDYDYGMVWRCVPPLFLDRDEVWLYYGGFDLRHGGDDRKGYLCLATMKKDRWAGYEAGFATGTIETTSISCDSAVLNICADVKDGGSIRVEVVGVSGLSLSDSIPVTADVTDGMVTWKAKDLSALIGKRIKIRFELKNATLYSFSFSNTPISTPKLPPTYTPSSQRDRYLLLDSRIIDSTSNASLELGTPIKHPANPLFYVDEPWVTGADRMYPSVVYDDQDNLYKCWYQPWLAGHTEALLYAESKDGLNWVKPNLGLVSENGSTANNIIMKGDGKNGPGTVHGPGIFIDEHETDPAKRFKMFTKIGPESGWSKAWMGVMFSADGIHWSEDIRNQDIKSDGDGFNHAFWAPALNKYIGISRHRNEAFDGRLAVVTESYDFVHWTKFTIMHEVFSWEEQIHDASAFCAFPGADIYIGLNGMMIGEHKGKVRNKVTQHIELMWSPDARKWTKIKGGVPFIPNSPGNFGEVYDWGMVIVGQPVFLDNEIRIYYAAGDKYFFGDRNVSLALATLRPDGFAGYEPTSTDTPAIITTKPVIGRFAALRITADVEAGGSVRVAVVDEQGKELARSEPVNSTVTNGKITWSGDWDLAVLSSKKIRLKFVLNNAKLYSFSFK